MKWTKSNHILSCDKTKKIIETILILSLKDSKQATPKYSESFFHQLPKEIILEIFQFLPLSIKELKNKKRIIDDNDTSKTNEKKTKRRKKEK